MADELSRALADEVQRRVASGHWVVVAIGGGNAIPCDVQYWCHEEFGVLKPILVVIEEATKQPPSADASDPHADDPGNPSTRENRS